MAIKLIAHISVPAFDAWVGKVTKTFDLKFLQGSVVGVDAAHYLAGLPKEPLLSALGGSPLALEAAISKAIAELHAAGLTLHFVFDGLDSGLNDDPFAASERAARLNNEAFALYESHQAEPAKQAFQSSGPCLLNGVSSSCNADNSLGASDFAALFEIMKKTLHENGVPFTVAPYSALAQVRNDLHLKYGRLIPLACVF